MVVYLWKRLKDRLTLLFTGGEMNRRMIGIANKLYEARDTLKALFPNYSEKTEGWQSIIRANMEENKWGNLEAVICLLKHSELTGYDKLWLQAAYLDMIEPG
jgi:hypothetical protein